MTTVAYKDGIVAYDSRCTENDRIVDDAIDKRISSNGIHYFFAGATSDYDLLVKAHQGESVMLPKNCNVSAIIVDGDKVYCAGLTNADGFFACPERRDNHFAIGSGQDHALTAMDMGADAKTAVKMAAKRDTGTGGRIRTYKIK